MRAASFVRTSPSSLARTLVASRRAEQTCFSHTHHHHPPHRTKNKEAFAQEPHKKNNHFNHSIRVVLTNTGDAMETQKSETASLLPKLIFLGARETLFLAFLVALALGQQYSVNVGQNTSRGNGHSLHHLVQLFVIADR